MDKEFFVSGYCRVLDQNRMVVVEICDGEVDACCSYPDCHYAPTCPVALKIQENTP